MSSCSKHSVGHSRIGKLDILIMGEDCQAHPWHGLLKLGRSHLEMQVPGSDSSAVTMVARVADAGCSAKVLLDLCSDLGQQPSLQLITLGDSCGNDPRLGERWIIAQQITVCTGLESNRVRQG